MDSHTDDLDQLTAEAEALLDEPSSTEQDQTLLGLAESVVAVNQVNIKTNQSIQRALASIEAAPGQLSRSVESSLLQLEKERQSLRSETAKLRAQTRSSWMAIAGGLLMLASVAFLMLYFFLWPAIAEYKAYQQTHQALEAGSVFGARVVEQGDDRFVVFDEGVVVDSNCNQPNCISVRRQ